MISLNVIYDKELIYYWCNKCGDINVPGGLPSQRGNPDDLPPMLKELYENYFLEDFPSRYIVNYKGEPAMALGVGFFWNSWAASLVGPEFDSNLLMEIVLTEIKKYGDELEAVFPGTEALVGEDTDPEGHELLLVVPFALRDKIHMIASLMAQDCYEKVGRQVKMAVTQLDSSDEVAKDPHKKAELLRIFASLIQKQSNSNGFASVILAAADKLEETPIAVVRGGVLQGVYSSKTAQPMAYELLDYDNYAEAEEGSEEYKGYQRLEKFLQM